MSQTPSKRVFDFYPLEERILLSAEAADVAGGEVDPDVAVLNELLARAELASAEQDQLATQSELGTVRDDAPGDATSPSLEERSLEVIFIDERVEDPDVLLAGLQELGGSDTEWIVIRLSASADGVGHVSATLADLSGVDAIHLLSHGDGSAIELGSTHLDSKGLSAYAGQVSGWGESLADDADLLIYGCDLASTESGRTLLQSFAELCRCDVAASDDATGHESLGGDWDLEYSIGLVETDVAIDEVSQQRWTHILPTWPSSWGDDNTQEWMTNVAFGTINNTSGADAGGYGDYTGLSTTVAQGSSTTLSVTINPATEDYINAWVDWNIDGDFDDPGEEFVLAANTSSAGPHSVSVVAPNDATVGTTRMRVSLKYFSAPPTSGMINWGEVEDYSVIVAAANDAPTFIGGDGITETDFAAGDDDAESIALQADGKILVAGRTELGGGGYAVGIARYNTDGTLDTGFGTGGRIVHSIGGINDVAKDIAVQSDGKIVATGATYDGAQNDLFIARYNSDGTPDGGFGTGGITVTDFPLGNSDVGQGIAIQSDGKIVIGGSSSNGTDFDFAVARYHSNGLLDTSFSGDGMATVAIGSADDRGRSVALQTDGNILIGGYSDSGSDYDYGLVRFLGSNGNLDSGFGTGGIVTTDFGGGSHDVIYDIGLQTDGKIVVAGQAGDTNKDFSIARYNSDGTPDNTFDSDGRTTVDLGTNSDFGHALAIRSDGRIWSADVRKVLLRRSVWPKSSPTEHSTRASEMRGPPATCPTTMAAMGWILRFKPTAQSSSQEQHKIFPVTKTSSSLAMVTTDRQTRHLKAQVPVTLMATRRSPRADRLSSLTPMSRSLTRNSQPTMTSRAHRWRWFETAARTRAMSSRHRVRSLH